MMLYIGMVGLFFIFQLVGVYLFSPIVIDDPSLTTAQAFAMGSFNGTVTSYAMLFTLLMLLLFSYALIKMLLKMHPSQRHKVSSSKQYDSISYGVKDYLAIKPFALHIAMGVIGLWLVFVIGTETLTYLLDKDPTAFVDDLYFSADPKWLLILVMVVVAPIYEEVVFRGVLWSAIVEQYQGKKGVWVASVVTSAIFALIHLQYELYEMSVIFLLALLLSYARAKSGSLLLPIVIHIINNGAAMWLYLMLI
ncbi:CPBP family intramembrane metalloprotease [Psychrobacter sp. FDAARGOS_221]|nr:CPBP family intramembrane metalloprotease [Psychrobacter sp. FDAARGOS_221]